MKYQLKNGDWIKIENIIEFDIDMPQYRASPCHTKMRLVFRTEYGDREDKYIYDEKDIQNIRMLFHLAVLEKRLV
jgi:hypothetical protein